MFHFALHHPRLSAWQNRLARVPRWGWALIGLAVVAPFIILMFTVLFFAVAAGLTALGVVLLLLALRSFWMRLTHRFKDDGRRNVRIVIHHQPENRVIDG